MASGIKNILAQFLMSKIGGKGGMTPYQEKSVELKEQDIERQKALAQIAGIDAQAKLMESKGEDYQAYLQKHEPLFSKWAAYRVQGGKVASNMDTANAISVRYARELQDTKNKVSMLETQADLATTKDKAIAGTLAKEIEDAKLTDRKLIATGRDVMYARLDLVKADNAAIRAGRDADPIKTPERTEAWNAQLDTNKKLTESILEQRGARGLPAEDTGVIEPPPRVEKVPPPTTPPTEKTPREKGEKFREAIAAGTMKFPTKAIDIGERISKGIEGGSKFVGGFLGTPERFDPVYGGLAPIISKLLGEGIYALSPTKIAERRAKQAAPTQDITDEILRRLQMENMRYTPSAINPKLFEDKLMRR